MKRVRKEVKITLSPSEHSFILSFCVCMYVVYVWAHVCEGLYVCAHEHT